MTENTKTTRKPNAEDTKSLSDEYFKDTNKAIKLKPLNSHLMNE